MRIDKFLKSSRILKRRTVAKDACEGGKVKVNGKESKPSREVREGDVVELVFRDESIKFEVLSVRETTKKGEADDMYRILGEGEENEG